MNDAGTDSRRVALRWPAPQPWPVLRAAVEALLRDLDAQLARRQPDWLGHCKALIAAGSGAAYASVTAAGEPPHWNGALAAPANEATLTLYAAVWGLPEAAVVAAVGAALDAWRTAVDDAAGAAPEVRLLPA